MACGVGLDFDVCRSWTIHDGSNGCGRTERARDCLCNICCEFASYLLWYLFVAKGSCNRMAPLVYRLYADRRNLFAFDCYAKGDATCANGLAGFF